MTSGPAEPVEVDARGLRCPIPVIRLAAAVRDLPPGSLARLRATDPAARSDVAAFCRMRGHQLVSTIDEPDGETAYLVRTSAPADVTPRAVSGKGRVTGR